jgi:hypothetical protein
MASIGLDFSQITPDNGAVRDINRLVFKDVLSAERIGTLLNIFPRVFNGDKLGLVGEFGLVGLEGTGCNPEWGNDAIATEEKTWDIATWQIAEKLCWADVENTLVKYTLNTGTDITDMTANDYLDEIVVPRLELAIMKMYIRIAFFGDTAAETVTDGGVIKDTVNPAYFTLTDGIFKQLFTSVTAGTTPHVAIAANSEATIAAQLAAINSEARTALDNMIAAANPALRQASDQVIYVTQAFASGLEAQLLSNCCGSDLAWTALFGGIRETTYRGIRLRVVPQWDEIIQSYEGDGVAYNLPFRAIYTTERNLALGVNGTDEFAGLRITFDPVTLYNYIYATDKMGALVLDDKMAVIGY